MDKKVPSTNGKEKANAEINGRCQYCQKLLLEDEVWTDPNDGSAICEDCYEDRMRQMKNKTKWFKTEVFVETSDTDDDAYDDTYDNDNEMVKEIISDGLRRQQEVKHFLVGQVQKSQYSEVQEASKNIGK